MFNYLNYMECTLHKRLSKANGLNRQNGMSQMMNSKFIMFSRLTSLGLLLLGFVILQMLQAFDAHAGAPGTWQDTAKKGKVVRIDASKHAGGFIIPIHQSQVLKLDQDFEELSVGNPDIADIVPLTKNTIYVLGKSIGTTNLTIMDGQKGLIAVVDLRVTYDLPGLKARLHQTLPNEKINVRPAEQSLVMSGNVSSSSALSQAMALAEQFAPEHVTNMLSVAGSQQVMLKVRFAEVQRSTMKDIGVSTLLQGTDGRAFFNVTGDGGNAESFLNGLGVITGGAYNLSFLIDALEEKGMVRTLAEPNLIALSGDTAKFLAGGEFPIPVAQSTRDEGVVITVEFKEFGVGLSFTPTVIGDQLINLNLEAEVSSIDPTVSVSTDRITIPGLKVRRSKTTVEIQDGQSFAISGLIQDDFTDTIRQIPGLGSVPILGALARSSGFQRQQTELVVFITSYLVTPTTESALAMPTDDVLAPSHYDFFLMGRLEGYEDDELVHSARGIDGEYGYILP